MTILWSLAAAIALVLAAVCGLLWLTVRRDPASLMLCILGVAAAASGYIELAWMHAATPAEFGEWGRLYYVPASVALIAQLLFVRYYLGTGRLWLMWTVIAARILILILNFSVRPYFGVQEIVSLRSVSLFGERVSVVGVAIPRPWQWLAVASLVLFVAFILDAAVQRWRSGGIDARRKALAVMLGMAVPLLVAFTYTQLAVFGLLRVPLSNMPWFLGALATMAYELGRDVRLSRRAQLELSELRAELAQVERVNLLGQLASTLSHELAQPLTATLVNVDTALLRLDRETPDVREVRAILGDIRTDNRRATEIIAGMRRLFKRRTIAMQPLAVDDLVRDAVSLVRSQAVSQHVLLEVQVPRELPRVLADRVHASQVLLNLLINAIHAVESRPRDARRIAVEARADDARGEVEIAVRDSGPGIPDSMEDRIFEAFFTTKSEGMGMGLALSRTIVEAHGGRLWIDRTAGPGGAVLRFTLRQASSPAPLVANDDSRSRLGKTDPAGPHA